MINDIYHPFLFLFIPILRLLLLYDYLEQIKITT